jgi:ABC-type multidrug transport system fused ATPase/permease subunit
MTKIGIVMWITLKTGLDFWLAHWSSNAQDDPEHGNGYYLGIYSIIGFTSVMFIFARIGLVMMRGYQVSRRLHAEMFGRIIRAPINLFFDRIPLGRLLNRFSTDLDIVDGSLPFTLGGLLYHPVNLTARLFMCYVAGSGWILPSIVAFGWLGVKIQQRYLSIYRESNRLCKQIN